ncbi:MAG: FkbM family methyltransferase [Verrucomicrobia bacterium]|nr:FkbM family methyltransferase [Verrucomicrobiota bacterium]
MHPALLAPFRLLREARSVLRLPHAVPDTRALFRCWLALRLAAGRGDSQPFSARLGPLTLHAHSWMEMDFLFNEVFLGREYFVALPGPAPRLIDCGANIGFATLYFKLRHPSARVTCFEPNPSCFALLEKNVRGNDLADVELIQAACGRENGAAKFYMSTGFSPMSSLDERRARDGAACDVRVVRLSDSVDGEVDLLKLDVEGAEWGVIEDLIASGKMARVRRMIIEYHHRCGAKNSEAGRFLQLLEDAGFTYSVGAFVTPVRKYAGTFQDVMIYAARRGTGGAAEPGGTAPGLELVNEQLQTDKPLRPASWARPWRRLRDTRRILRLPDAKPGARALLEAWREIGSAKLVAPGEPARCRLASHTLFARDTEELWRCFDDVFFGRHWDAKLPGDAALVVDFGAGIGFSTLYLALAHPAARVLAFESDPAAAALLNRNVRENRLQNVTVVSPGSGSPSEWLAGQLSEPVDFLKLDAGEAALPVLVALQSTGKLALVKRLAVRGFHRRAASENGLGRLLRLLEAAGFTYDLLGHVPRESQFSTEGQAFMVFASRLAEG